MISRTACAFSLSDASILNVSILLSRSSALSSTSFFFSARVAWTDSN